MSKAVVRLICWKHGHVTEVVKTKKGEEKLADDIKKMKAVCPTCRDSGEGNQALYILQGQNLFHAIKPYQCVHGHVSTIGAFANGRMHVSFGPQQTDFENFEGTIEEMPELVATKEVFCNHTREDGRKCGCKLKAMDSTPITYPSSCGIKTKTRVGDVWDKQGIEPVRDGTYDGQGNYNGTKTETANKVRLARIKERNLSAQKYPGQRIDRATKTDYGRRDKASVKPERLNRRKK